MQKVDLAAFSDLYGSGSTNTIAHIRTFLERIMRLDRLGLPVVRCKWFCVL